MLRLNPFPTLLPAGALLLACFATPLHADQPVLLNELKVNPPGNTDAPNEFIEIKGPPATLLTNLHFLAIDGNSSGNPGLVTYALNLNGARLGTNGLLLIVATNHPYTVPAATTIIFEPQFALGNTLPNNTVSFLLVSNATPISQGEDLDRGNNGILEGMPAGAILLDSIGWSDGDNNDIVYGPKLTLAAGAPDAATRFSLNNTPLSAAAWFAGKLAHTAQTLIYDTNAVTPNFPPGTLLTPGDTNNTAPLIGPIVPVSGVIGDPANPVIQFTVSDAECPASNLIVTVTSANPAVAPDTNLLLTPGPAGSRTLAINPVGVGYSDLTISVTDGSVTGHVTFPYAASAPGQINTTWYQGSSDGSTAIAVDPDYIFIGDDENQSLRLYPRHRSGLPLALFDMNPFLGLTDLSGGVPREVDIEASTHSGNRLFWAGSHGHGDLGEARPNRSRIFATDLSRAGSNSTLAYAGRYDYLKTDLINWDKKNLHGKGTNYYGLEASDAVGVPPKVPDGSGFAIEGLAMMPASTNGAYVAFRAPIVPATNRNYALIVPVLNFATLAASGSPAGSALFGPPIELDLYGRGIRSLEGSTNGFIISAGPAAGAIGVYPQDFRLYTWTGNPADLPQQRTADLSGLGPEGIVELPPGPWTPATTLELLTDNGGTVFYADGIKAKDLLIPNFKKCRVDLVALGRPIKPAPLITQTSLQGSTLTLRWRSLKGETYHVQSATQLSPPNWTDVPGTVLAPGPYTALTLASAPPTRFFRVLLADYP